MSNNQIQSSENSQINTNNNNIINQEKIINTTRTKKIIVTNKTENFKGSPQRINYTSRIYNRRVVSPLSRKKIQNSPKRIYHINQIEEIKEKKEKNINDNNVYITNISRNKENIIFNKEDFNNNNFYQNESQYDYYQEKNSINKEKTISIDTIKNKRLLKYNYNYISPKKDSKVLLKTVICNPVSVRFTEINDAELKMNKKYEEKIEEFEETEITIKNKIINIWENTNKIINECSFSLIEEDGLERKYVIDSYEKKIEELKEIISNLSKEKEQNKKNEFLDNIIQSFNFTLKRKSIKPNDKFLSVINMENLFIPSKQKFNNIKQKINAFSIYRKLKPKNLIQSIGQIQIIPNQILKSNQKPIIKNKIDKINDIFIESQKKQKFSSDKIFGQELCILAKKKKKIPLEMNFNEEIRLSEEENFFMKRINNNNLPQKIESITIDCLPMIKEIEKRDDIIIDGIINKPENTIEQNIELFIESNKKLLQLDIEYMDSFILEEISRQKNYIKIENEITILGQKRNLNLEVNEIENIILEGKENPIYEIENIEEIELINIKEYSDFNYIEKVDDFYFLSKKKYNNLDIEIIDDIFYDEIPRPENEIEELELFSLINEKQLIKYEAEKIEDLEIIPDKNDFLDFLIEKNDSFIIINNKSNEEDSEYINKYKKRKYNYEYQMKNKTNNNYISDNYDIEDTANFQIIAMNIREIYQQKLQGFSIIKKEKQPNKFVREIYFSIFKENNFTFYNDKNISNMNLYKNNIYNINKNTNEYSYKTINKDRKFIRNKINFDNNKSNVRNINTIISHNYKTFIAIPNNTIEYINPTQIFNESINNNDMYYSEDEDFKRKKLFKKYKSGKKELNKNNINNEINGRYKSKIILRKYNYSNNCENNNNNLNNSLVHKEKQFSNIQTERNYNYNISTPIKIKNRKNKSEYKPVSENRIYRRKIYRFEEGNKFKIINNNK